MSKILVIEDESAIRRVLVKILSEESDTYQVDEAEDGLVGIEKIKATDYDLVLCDIKMPKMDGVEVLVGDRIAVFTTRFQILAVPLRGEGRPFRCLTTRVRSCGAYNHRKMSSGMRILRVRLL